MTLATLRRLALLALAPLTLVGIAQPAAAQSGGQVIRVDLNGGSASQSLSLPRGKSAIIELPVDARDVLVSDPEVAEVALRTPRRIYILGMGAGQTDAVFFDASGRRILRVDIRVDADTSALEDTLNRVMGGRIKVEPAANGLILTGTVATAPDAERAQKIAERFVSRPDMIVNALSIAGKEQVMLRVRIVEMQRSVIKQLGANVDAIFNQNGDSPLSLNTARTFGVNGGIQGGLISGLVSNLSGDDQVTAALSAFERVGLVRTLAEPNLTAVSGEAGNFLVGGEFPIPVAEDDNGRITVTYKSFGVSLGYTPVVLSEGRISLRLSTEVSELSTIGAFSSGGLVLPAINVRRAETTVELPSGGAMMIAGLLQERTRQNLDKVPGIGSVPVLGALFRSRDFLNDESELVIIVTPYIVDPTSPSRLQTPADGFRLANDLRATFLGKVNEVYAPVAGGAPATTAAYQGPVGPVIE